MDWKVFATVFVTMFLAELGDKSQVAALLFAADREVSKWLVWAAASAALMLALGISVAAGGAIAQFVSAKNLHYAAGAGFLAIGAWTLYTA